MRSHPSTITRLVTVWLIVLIVSPWTAPFAACDPGAGITPVSSAVTLTAPAAGTTPSLSDPDDAATSPLDSGVRVERLAHVSDPLTVADGFVAPPRAAAPLPVHSSLFDSHPTADAVLRV
jgi:hypothetical protein